MKRKLILSSIMTIILALSLIAGSTFALFTSQSKVNITVGSAKVSLLSMIDQSSLELYSLDVKQDTQFENGGTATFTDTANLVLDNVTPGDKAVFNIVMTNDSTVDIQYRVAWSIKGALACGLVTKVDGRVINNNTSDWTEWKTPVSDADKTRTLSVSVELPVEAGNEFQECSADISFSVVAVQGNGTEIYLPSCDVVATPETIDAVLAEAKAGSVIGLAAGNYGSITIPQHDMTLLSELAVLDYVNLNAKDNVKLIGLTFDAAGAKMSYEMTSTAGVNQEFGIYANIVGAENSATAADNVLIQNCTFTGTPTTPDSYSPIVFAERRRKTASMKGFTVDGCTFETDAAYYIYARYLGKGDNVIINNTFGTPAGASANTVIYCGNGRSDIQVKGNTFYNWKGTTLTATAHSDTLGPKTITVCKNTYINTMDSDSISVMALRKNIFNAGAEVIMLNNTANFGLYSLGEVYDGGNDYYHYAMTGTERVKLAYDDDSLVQGGNLYLVNDVVLDADGTAITEDSKIHLNGYSITSDRNYVEGTGQTTAEISTLYIDGATVEIDGEGTVANTAPEAAYAISIYGGAKVTIKSGNYISYHDAIYVKEGDLVIEGGFFQALGDVKPYPDYVNSKLSDTPAFMATVINCYKASFADGSATVAISGGTFVNEDPTNVYEGYSMNHSFVIDGYTTVSETKSSEEVWYTVIPE